MLLGCVIDRDVTSFTGDENGNTFSIEEPQRDITTNTYNADGLRVRDEHAEAISQWRDGDSSMDLADGIRNADPGRPGDLCGRNCLRPGGSHGRIRQEQSLVAVIKSLAALVDATAAGQADCLSPEYRGERVFFSPDFTARSRSRRAICGRSENL